MSSTRNRRVPVLARSLALGLLPLGGAVLAAGPGELPTPDGVRFCGAEARSSEYQDLALYDTGAGLALGLVPLDELVDELLGIAKAGGSGCAKATAANLAIAFEGQDAVLLAGPVNIGGGGTSVGVLDPVICTSYGTAGSGLTLRVTDTNDVEIALPGWSGISYQLGNHRLVPTSLPGLRGPLNQCHSFAWSQLLSNPPVYGAPGEDFGIFGGSFENRGDLLVEIIDPESGNRVGQLETTQDLPFTYQLRVSNVGESDVAGVRIREFLPRLTLEPVVSEGSWTCSRSTGACPAASGAGQIAVDGLTLGRDESITYEITRALPGALPGQLSMVAAAAFVDPSHATAGGEKNPADNAQPLVLSVVANKAPIVSCAPSTLGNLQEDGATVPVSCTATDPDGDAVVAMGVTDVGGGGSPVALSGVSHAAGTLDFEVTPKPDASGSTTLHVTAEDALGATSAAFAIPVTVAAVNDQPTFAARATSIDVDAAGSNLMPGVFLFAPDCTSGTVCNVIMPAFFHDFDAGAPNESGQSVQPHEHVLGYVLPSSCGVAEAGEDVSHFFVNTPRFDHPAETAPRPFAGDPTYLLTFSYKVAATGSVFCDFRFVDSGGAVSEPVRVTFNMVAPPPP